MDLDENTDDKEEDEDDDLDFVEPQENSEGTNPKIGEFWRVGSREGNYYFVVVETVEADSIGVKFFKSSSRDTGMYFKNDRLYLICPQDLDKKVNAPNAIERGRRTFYSFKTNEETMYS